MDTDYATMTIEETAALPVGTLADDDAIVWVWTTNAKLRHVFPLLDVWGLKEQTMLTWIKNKPGNGWYLRNQTEHCVVASRGRPKLALRAQRTILRAAVREHSRKPDEFYALVKSLCAGSKLDMFARQSRKGWVTWGAEATKFDREATGS